MKSLKVGILGGGQLARMLILEGHKLGLEMHVLCQSKSEPAAQVTAHTHIGPMTNPHTLINFAKNVDTITFESEFLDDKVTKDKNLLRNQKINPSLHLIAQLSNRLTQKLWLEKYNIPTAQFIAPQNKTDVFIFLNDKRKHLVFKKLKFGYDGYGTFILKNKSQIVQFVKENEKSLQNFIAEDYCAFRRELAITFTRSSTGDICEFPVVEWRAKDSKCYWVKGPYKSTRLNALIKKIRHALHDSLYVGTIAFELFETKNNIIVNEVAPRVHNSSHYSLEACTPNQFSAHLMAVTGQRLPANVHLNSPAFAMVNLIGSADKTPDLPSPQNIALHWYGKKENRKGRKMGHTTLLSTTPNGALKALLKYHKKIHI